MMFFASTFNVYCRKASRNFMAFIFTGIGIGMSCWFVTGLMGISLSMEHLRYIWHTTKDVAETMVTQMPGDWPMP